MYIKISEDYTNKPGGRYITSGPFSGEDFRKNFLLKKLFDCKKRNKRLILDFDGSQGYSECFIDEAFGGLVREEGFTMDEIFHTISFISYENSDLIHGIIKSINESEKDIKKLKLK